ncbi:hypothetical protein A3F00_01785 [Candidatus Daviesbacteria bacterium RIFCSPHIGHO2_12_FULL_37_11]|uniref:Uncharacterized protein n=1 Tax=Candidatus Daviesbacteria bacterium RIFCSPHIGHO2_12_FULL_37_11 TaxID=1797777 RepID=A0A1F5KDH7_9BACT|nr:MAG: hypothetical protein A3F00_01785 [Candidatus Daviesbacteria bacterium RIFCSPHIGHO2_12_FULL_37_11]OGE45563.1 MAG: hypothetical protein A3B39_05130 [Candidatus Daviesbacteria bacterium RIFCSPLOWO2_01_FULL_37_10]
MENSQLNPQAPQSIPVDPNPVVTPLQPNTSSSGNSRKILIVISILAVLTLVAGGLIYFRGNLKFNKSQTAQTVQNAFDDLKTDLEATDVGASEDDLSSFDKDLNSL